MRVFWSVLALTALVATVPGAQQPPAGDPSPAEIKAVVDKAVAYLKGHQDEDGSFSKRRGGPGITGLVVAGLLRHGAADEGVVAKGLKYLESNVRDDGGIYDRQLANYVTSVALIAFKEANQGGKYDPIIKKAVAFLKTMQNGDEAKPEHFGGAGYDAKSRPDLSNTQYFLEALKAAGVGNDDPAVKRAVTFLGRCQNLPGEHNELPWAKNVSEDDKGGFVYNPAGRKDGQTAGGGLRSEGAMTYAGLKSFLYAGVDKNDPRVKAAVGWIQRHYTLEENAPHGTRGLYYYYHTFAKAMAALGQEELTDAKGVKHRWKRDLFEALKSRQKPDGSWVNPGDDTFYEGDPNLCTGFALLALSYCK